MPREATKDVPEIAKMFGVAEWQVTQEIKRVEAALKRGKGREHKADFKRQVEIAYSDKQNLKALEILAASRGGIFKEVYEIPAKRRRRQGCRVK